MYSPAFSVCLSLSLYPFYTCPFAPTLIPNVASQIESFQNRICRRIRDSCIDGGTQSSFFFVYVVFFPLSSASGPVKVNTLTLLYLARATTVHMTSQDKNSILISRREAKEDVRIAPIRLHSPSPSHRKKLSANDGGPSSFPELGWIWWIYGSNKKRAPYWRRREGGCQRVLAREKERRTSCRGDKNWWLAGLPAAAGGQGMAGGGGTVEEGAVWRNGKVTMCNTVIVAFRRHKGRRKSHILILGSQTLHNENPSRIKLVNNTL